MFQIHSSSLGFDRNNNRLQLVNGEQSGETVILMVSRVFTLWDPGLIRLSINIKKEYISPLSDSNGERLQIIGIELY